MTNPTEPFSVRFASARAKSGMSQEKAAKVVGVSALTISNWEKGKARPAGGRAQEKKAIAVLEASQAVIQPTPSPSEAQAIPPPPPSPVVASVASDVEIVSNVQVQLDQMRAMIEGLVKAQTQPKPVAETALSPVPVPPKKVMAMPNPGCAVPAVVEEPEQKLPSPTPQDMANAVIKFTNLTHYSHKMVADLLGANIADVQNWLQGRWYRPFSAEEAQACMAILKAKPILLARQQRAMAVRTGGGGGSRFPSGMAWNDAQPNLSAADVLGAVGGKIGM